MVNITAVMALGVLTTNVTGHFAFFSEEVALNNTSAALAYLLYIIMFLLGAFVSSSLLEYQGRRGVQGSYLLPISLEIILLILVSFFPFYLERNTFTVSLFAPSILLFAMGLQNALVTRVSHSVVRTTHLTGLFTDLGIDLSGLLFNRNLKQRKVLKKNVHLKLAIILCFFGGGLLGGLLYGLLGLKTLLIPAALLLFSLYYDRLLFRYKRVKRKLRTRWYLKNKAV